MLRKKASSYCHPDIAKATNLITYNECIKVGKGESSYQQIEGMTSPPLHIEEESPQRRVNKSYTQSQQKDIYLRFERR